MTCGWRNRDVQVAVGYAEQWFSYVVLHIFREAALTSASAVHMLTDDASDTAVGASWFCTNMYSNNPWTLVNIAPADKEKTQTAVFGM